jgi:hypothetical protein
MRWAIVSDKIETFYESDVKIQYGGDWGTMNHVPVPENMDWTTVSWNGSEIVQDPAKVQAKTDAQWTALRSQRDTLLTQSDWRVLPFAPLSPEAQQAWVTYRQALRDLPGVTSDPTQVTWPIVPSP